MGDRVVANRFELERLLGRGGMSEVWLAHDRELDRDVAVKLNSPRADRARFEREARAAARLSHPNVARIFDYGEVEGEPYLVLEYLPGGSLEDRLALGGPLPDDESERIARDIAGGLTHAQECGLVHRDLKPSNVMFDADGTAKIADFGIARAYGQTTLTDAGTVLGTAAYMSPEQAAGEPVTPASDIYSFGAILFRMLTGQLPFEGETPVELALNQRREPAPTVESRRPDAPAVLSALATAALAKDPRSRPTAAEIAGALRNASRSSSGATTPTLALDAARGSTGNRKRVARLVVLGVLAFAGVATGVLAFGDVGQAPGTPPSTTERGSKTTRTRSTERGGSAPSQAGSSTGAMTDATTDAQVTTRPTTQESTSPTTAPAPSNGEETSPEAPSPDEETPAESGPVVTEPPPPPAPTATTP